jgi:adenylosuccinate synthase
VDVSYVTLPGWQSPITFMRSFDGLPDNCKKYVNFIEDFLGIPIGWVGVGPGRESMLKKDREV